MNTFGVNCLCCFFKTGACPFEGHNLLVSVIKNPRGSKETSHNQGESISNSKLFLIKININMLTLHVHNTWIFLHPEDDPNSSLLFSVLYCVLFSHKNVNSSGRAGVLTLTATSHVALVTGEKTCFVLFESPACLPVSFVGSCDLFVCVLACPNLSLYRSP